MCCQRPFALSLAAFGMSGGAPSFDERTVELLVRNSEELCVRSWELGTHLEALIELYRTATR